MSDGTGTEFEKRKECPLYFPRKFYPISYLQFFSTLCLSARLISRVMYSGGQRVYIGGAGVVSSS